MNHTNSVFPNFIQFMQSIALQAMSAGVYTDAAPTDSSAAGAATLPKVLTDLPDELLWHICIWLTEAEAFAILGSVCAA